MTETPRGDAADSGAGDEFSSAGAGGPEPELVEGDVVDDTVSADDDAVNTEAVNDTDPPLGDEVPGSGELQDPFAEGEADRIAAEHAASAKAGAPAPVSADAALAAERLGDLQRVQAEYVNYKRRVDRDRAVVQELAVHSVIESLLPVLDDIHAARAHGDLVDGPFASIADKLESTLGKFGLTQFGAAGEEFDPAVHEALMHTAWDPTNEALPKDAQSTTVVTVLQPGYRAGERVIRPARVAVADPE